MPSIHRAWFRWCASIVGIIACCLLYAPLQAQADELSFDPYYPAGVNDITTDSFDVEYAYNAGNNTGTLTTAPSADGYSQMLLDNGNDTFYQYGDDVYQFSITANINPATGALIGGTVTIAGDDLYDAPYYNGTLLTGNLTGFGFPTDYDESSLIKLTFEFQVTGGEMTLPGGPFAGVDIAGMNMYMYATTAPFAGSWPADTSWGSGVGNTNNSDPATNDTFPVSLTPTPEPSTLVLLAIGILPLAWRLRRRGQ
jgi:PEP-CTERM motif